MAVRADGNSNFLVDLVSSAFDMYYNMTGGEKTVAGVGMAAAVGLIYLATTHNSPQQAIDNCKTQDGELLKIWPGRIQSAIDVEGKKWQQYNEPAAQAYRNVSLTLSDLNDAYEKDRKAYVDFCRVGRVFNPLLKQFSEEASEKEKPWMDCRVFAAKTALEENCFKAFDSLRKTWSKVYEARLYQGGDYLKFAVSWFSSRVLKQPAGKALKSIPQQILDSNLEGKSLGEAWKVLSFIRPFETELYCEKGCSFVKKRYHELMLHAHPDKNPFPDAPSIEEASRLGNRVSQIVNNARDALCDKKMHKEVCRK